MIPAGELFDASEDDGYHAYPRGQWRALRNITAEEVRELFTDESLTDVLYALKNAGAIEPVSLAVLEVRPELDPGDKGYSKQEVSRVGTWSRPRLAGEEER